MEQEYLQLQNEIYTSVNDRLVKIVEKENKPNLFILIGPPCSGKSSFLKKLEYWDSDIRINQDDIRSMIKSGKYKFKKDIERLVSESNDMLAEMWLREEYDVYLDNTYCNPTILKKTLARFKGKASIKIILFEQPLWKLKLRNIIRYIKKGVWIPPKVIRSMCNNLEKVKQLLKTEGFHYSLITDKKWQEIDLKKI